MSTTPITSASGLASAAAAASPANSSTSSASGAGNEDIFLQLLVAQLKYQDPSNPASGTEFVTQLATFSSLQENTQTATDLDSILGLMRSAASNPATTATSTSGSGAATPAAASDAATSAAANAAAAAAAGLAATGLSGSTSPASSTTGF